MSWLENWLIVWKKKKACYRPLMTTSSHFTDVKGRCKLLFIRILNEKNHHNSKEKVPREWRTRWRIPWFWNICQVFKERRILWASSSGQRQFKSRFVACARRLVFREANPPGGIQGWSGAAGGADLKPRYIGPVATIAKIVVAAYWVPLLWNNISEKAAC